MPGMLRATECLRAARLELRPTPASTSNVFVGVPVVLTKPLGSLLGAETADQNFSTQFLMALHLVIFAYLRRPNFRCVTILFFKRL
jgi:hypothetical protein